jgi:hypothetical protein
MHVPEAAMPSRRVGTAAEISEPELRPVVSGHSRGRRAEQPGADV